MLTPRENLLATIREGGKPDRFVNQWESYGFIMGSPLVDPFPMPGGDPVVDSWGVTKQWKDGQPGPFPIHDPEHIVVQDIERWSEYVKAPNFKFGEAAWEPLIAMAEGIDRTQQFVMVMLAPGIFEQCHYLCEIVNTLEYLYEYPDEMKEMIKYLTEYEMVMAEEWCKHVKPDAINHHDDWGMQASTFMSPDMFADYFLESYKQIYGYYHDHGVEVVMHHSDSFGATLVPYMIEMGIDIWQGVLDTNNIPEMLKKYAGKIAFHGGINNGKYDVADYDPQAINQALRDLVAGSDHGKYLIPGLCAGGPGGVFPGVYEATSAEIDKINQEFIAQGYWENWEG